MKKFNLSELVSQLTVDHREFDIGDSIAILFKCNFLPIRINSVVKEELKVFKSCFCIYDGYIEGYTIYDYQQPVEVLVLEEYSDSPYSIYIYSNGKIDTYEYDDIHTIEIGDILVLKVKDNVVTHYQIKEIQDV